MELDQQPDAATSQKQDSLQRPRHCGQCGYDLNGLPDSGRCPECGEIFSPDEIVFFGYGGPTQMIAGTKLPRFLKLNIIAALSQVVCFFGALLMKRYSIAVIWALGALIHLAVIFMHYARRKNSPAPFQVRFSRDGFGQRIGCGPISLTQWKPEDRVRVEDLAEGQTRIYVEQAPRAAIKQPGERADGGIFVDLVIHSSMRSRLISGQIESLRSGGIATP